MNKLNANLIASAIFIACVCGPAMAAGITWDGGPDGTGTNWNDAVNWSGDVKPGSTDSAIFADTGISASKIIALGANQTISNLVFQTATAFTIGHANDVTPGYTLTLTNVDRQDVSGTEGTHTLAAAVVLAANSQWTINGSGYLQSTSAAGISGSYTLTKLGASQLRMGNNGYTGDTYVRQGDLYLTANVGIRGSNLYIGTSDGSTTATCTRNTNNNVDYITGTCSITVYPGSSLQAGREAFKNLTVNNGSANLATYCYLSGNVYLTGGTVTGGSGNQMVNISTYADDTTSLISSTVRQYNSANWIYDIANGVAPIDFEISGLISGTSAYSLRKDGAGALLLSRSAGNEYSYVSTIVNVGTLLIGNTSGSATGNSLVDVKSGSTLGGAGIIGGVAGYTKSNVSVGGGASVATVAPGAMDPTTGSSLIGTMTVGGAAQTNNVTFGSNSRLQMQIGAAGNADRLTIYGTLNLSSTTDSLALTADADAKGGTYTLVNTTGGITGTFNDSSSLPHPERLTYTLDGKSIEYFIPSKGTLIFIE